MKGDQHHLQRPHHPAAGGHAHLAAWLNSVYGAGKQLQRVIRLSEGEFLLVGRTLGQCHARAQQLDGLSAAISGIMTGPEIAQAVDDLNRLIGDMETYLGRTASGTSALLAALRDIIGKAGALRQPLADFLARARRLMGMAAALRDHHAAATEDDAEVVGLLTEAHSLSEIMAGRAGALVEGLDGLRTRLEHTRQQCTDFEETRLARLKLMIGDTAAVLCSLTEQYGRAAVASRAAVERSQLIARSTGAIVVSCQFHDITRQQFEKVQHALVDVSRHLSAMAEGSAVLPPEEEADLMAEVGHFSSRCAEDLGTIRDSFVSSVDEITGNLRRIAEDAGTMAREMRKMAEDPRSGQRSLLMVIGDVLRSVRSTVDALAESAEAQDTMCATVAELSDMTAGMAGYFADLDEITCGIRQLVLHTEVRVSEEGWPAPDQEAVAGKLQLLAAETCCRARNVAGGLAALNAVVAELVNARTGGEPGSGEWVQSMARHLDGLVTVLTKLNERILSLIDEVDEAGSSLAGEIGDLMDKVRGHRLVDSAVCGFVGVLREVAPAGKTAAGFSEPRWLPGSAYRHMDGGSGTGQTPGGSGVEFF